jgi:hypothetical protein
MTTKAPKPAIAGLDDEASYRVTIIKSVEARSVPLRRNSRPVLKGKVIKEIAASVGEFELVTR